MLNHYLVHIRNAAQRWLKIQNMGQSPHRRSAHTMVSKHENTRPVRDRTRVFVLGGVSPDTQADDISFIHVFDTSMYVRPINLSVQRSMFRTQRTSNTRNPSVTRSILMRRLHNFAGVIHRPLDRGQPQHPTSSSSDAHGAVCKRLATPYRARLLADHSRAKPVSEWSAIIGAHGCT